MALRQEEMSHPIAGLSRNVCAVQAHPRNPGEHVDLVGLGGIARALCRGARRNPLQTRVISYGSGKSAPGVLSLAGNFRNELIAQTHPVPPVGFGSMSLCRGLEK